jgi:hypothetical protein
MRHDKRYCLICRPKNRTIYFHLDEKTGLPWLWCNKCDRGYSLKQYCETAGIDIDDFLVGEFHIEDGKHDEVNAMAWPHNFVVLSDPRAKKGVDYINSRGISAEADIYYDIDQEGIVFPYYLDNYFCGAQIRFLKERQNEQGDNWKITTLPGTRLGLLFYGWNQGKLLPQVKGVIVTEGAFNSISIQQSLNEAYGGVSNCPWRVFACSGSGLSSFQAEELKRLKDSGYKVIGAPDTDEAGFKMLSKMIEHDCISHYVMVDEEGRDWNDLLKLYGRRYLAKYVIKGIKPINEIK